MAGIDSLISNRVDAFANNPQALMQRYSMSQDLLDLLALQKLKQDKEAAARTLQMQMQAPQGTVKDQLEGQVMDMTRREVAQAAAPGLQQQGQQMQAQQIQEAMSAGLPTQPAPALVGMAGGGIVGYQGGGDIVGYDGEGNPITREEFDAIVRSGERPSGYELRQRERARMQERAGPEMQEFMQEAGEAVTGARDYIVENPLEAAGYAAMAIPAAGQAGAGLRLGAAGLQKAGPALMRGIRSLYSKPNPAFSQRFSKKGTRIYTTGQPERLYSPGRTAATGTGLAGLDYLLDMFGGEENQESSEDTSSSGTPVSERFEPGFRNTSRDTSVQDVPRNVPVSDELAGLAALGPQALRRRPSDVVPSSAADPAAPAAPASSQDPEVEYLRSLNRQHYAAPEVTQQAQAERPQFRSRYEDRLAEIEAEKQDKLGALIEFLQAAGASGGTNLGATLTGGGSGLRARDERLRQQETEALQGAIEEEQAQQMMDFRERDLAQQAAQAAEDRAFRLQLFGQEAALRRELESMGISSTEKIAQGRNELEAKLRASIDAGNIRSDEAAQLRNEYENYAKQYQTLLEAYYSGTLVGEDKLSVLKNMQLITDKLNTLSGRTTTELDAETQALLDQYNTGS